MRVNLVTSNWSSTVEQLDSFIYKSALIFILNHLHDTIQIIYRNELLQTQFFSNRYPLTMMSPFEYFCHYHHRPVMSLLCRILTIDAYRVFNFNRLSPKVIYVFIFKKKYSTSTIMVYTKTLNSKNLFCIIE